MPFDLMPAAQRLRSRYADKQAFRLCMFDLLFAIGTPVREQALALEFGDVLSMEVVGPAAPNLEPPLVLVVVDVEPPHLSTVTRAVGKPAAWAPGLSSLGGSASAVAWAACLHQLAGSKSQRPWRAHYLRGPAAGISGSLPFLLGELEAEAEVVHVVPSVSTEPLSGPVDLMRVDLSRSRNVWRFPACDHTYALSGDVSWADAATALPELVDSLGKGVNWTLHDLHVYQCEQIHLSAVLRTSAPIAERLGSFTAAEVDSAERLMFPVNDALGGLRSLASRMAPQWGDALHQSLHLHVLPDGLRAFSLVPGEAEPDLPERLGSLALSWQRDALSRPAKARVVPLAVGETEFLGPIPAGLAERTNAIWQVPPLRQDDELPGLMRALSSALASSDA
ncbi:MAG: hypothetical protein KC502_00315 [Myxococcales bacterium]|nr:hypothetical protein [Myxococcales bacterium]